jgi:D-amino peptidase
MKIYISVDMEGISGILNWDQTRPGTPDYQEARRYMTADINACVQGCFEGGATEVIVADKHHAGRNVIWHELDARASYVIGVVENSPDGRLPDLEECDGLILLGYHAMAGTPDAVLRHTWSLEWQNVWINGRVSGEIAIDAAIAADCAVPTIMISGDDRACAEALEFLPGIVTAPVKKALSRSGAKLLSQQTAHALIASRAAQAVRNCGQMQPLMLDKPVTIRLQLTDRTVAFNEMDRPYAKVIDSRTYEVVGDDFRQAFFRLNRM